MSAYVHISGEQHFLELCQHMYTSAESNTSWGYVSICTYQRRATLPGVMSAYVHISGEQHGQIDGIFMRCEGLVMTPHKGLNSPFILRTSLVEKLIGVG
jgi:hypothetical protein